MYSRHKSFMDYRQCKYRFPLWIAFHFFNNFFLKKDVLMAMSSVFLLRLVHFVLKILKLFYYFS